MTIKKWQGWVKQEKASCPYHPVGPPQEYGLQMATVAGAELVSPAKAGSLNLAFRADFSQPASARNAGINGRIEDRWRWSANRGGCCFAAVGTDPEGGIAFEMSLFVICLMRT